MEIPVLSGRPMWVKNKISNAKISSIMSIYLSILTERSKHSIQTEFSRKKMKFSNPYDVKRFINTKWCKESTSDINVWRVIREYMSIITNLQTKYIQVEFSKRRMKFTNPHDVKKFIYEKLEKNIKKELFNKKIKKKKQRFIISRLKKASSN